MSIHVLDHDSGGDFPGRIVSTARPISEGSTQSRSHYHNLICFWTYIDFYECNMFIKKKFTRQGTTTVKYAWTRWLCEFMQWNRKWVKEFWRHLNIRYTY